jgi:hypothetical protein
MVLLRQAGREIAEVKLHRATKRGAQKSGGTSLRLSEVSKEPGPPAEPVHGQPSPRRSTVEPAGEHGAQGPLGGKERPRPRLRQLPVRSAIRPRTAVDLRRRPTLRRRPQRLGADPVRCHRRRSRHRPAPAGILAPGWFLALNRSDQTVLPRNRPIMVTRHGAGGQSHLGVSLIDHQPLDIGELTSEEITIDRDPVSGNERLRLGETTAGCAGSLPIRSGQHRHRPEAEPPPRRGHRRRRCRARAVGRRDRPSNDHRGHGIRPDSLPRSRCHTSPGVGSTGETSTMRSPGSSGRLDRKSSGKSPPATPSRAIQAVAS